MFKPGDLAVMVADTKYAAKQSWPYLGHVVRVVAPKRFVFLTGKEMYAVETLDGKGQFMAIPQVLFPLPPDWEQMANAGRVEESTPA